MKITVYTVDVDPPNWLRNVLRVGLPALVLFGASVAIATVGQFNTGDTLTAAALNGAFAAAAPTGAVVAFNLDACPTGWTEFTAVRGRAVVGTNPVGNALAAHPRGDVFGEETHALTVAEMPSHAHGGAVASHATGISIDNEGAHTHYYQYIGGSGPGAGPYSQSGDAHPDPQGGTTNPGSAHTHGVTDPGHVHAISAEGGGQASSVVPPSLALLYCMKS